MSYDPNFRADVRQLQRRIQGLLQRGVVKTVDDALKMQTLDVELHHGFAPTKLEHWQPYGFHFHPQPDSEVLVGALGGNQDHLMVLGTADRRERPKNLQPGDVQMYRKGGATLTMKDGGVIEIKTGSSKIVMSPGGIEIHAAKVEHIKA